MTEKEKAEVEILKAKARNIRHNTNLKWYAAFTATFLGGTPLIKVLKDFIHTFF